MIGFVGTVFPAMVKRIFKVNRRSFGRTRIRRNIDLFIGFVRVADIDDTEQLVLLHDENIFSVQFAALDYTNPQNVQYAYILDGFEKQWTFADKQRSVTYTNLPKGEYVLRVRSTNSDGVWVENERVLDIVILP